MRRKSCQRLARSATPANTVDAPCVGAGVYSRPVFGPAVAFDSSGLCFHGGIHPRSLGVLFIVIAVIEPDHAKSDGSRHIPFRTGFSQIYHAMSLSESVSLKTRS